MIILRIFFQFWEMGVFLGNPVSHILSNDEMYLLLGWIFWVWFFLGTYLPFLDIKPMTIAGAKEISTLILKRGWSTGCSLNIVFFKDLIYIPDSCLSRFPLVLSVCVHNDRSNTSTAAALAELRKITTFLGKNTQYLMITLYLKTRA